MSSMVCLEIPREVLHSTRMTVDELRRELALRLYEQGKLSFGKAREMTGLSAWAFQQLLGSLDIPVHYDIADYEEDLATLRGLGRL
jgi:predicted HTH domain antitoxin